MSRKPKDRDRRPERWANHEKRERVHQAVDVPDEEAQAVARCLEVLMEAGALKPRDGGAA